MAKLEVAYSDRLKALQADNGLFRSLKDFVLDLKNFKNNRRARLRLLQEPTAEFYMSSAYFTPGQAQVLLLFKGRDGLTLEQALQSRIARKLQTSEGEVSSARYELCTSHVSAPIFQEHFSLAPPDFFIDLCSLHLRSSLCALRSRFVAALSAAWHSLCFLHLRSALFDLVSLRSESIMETLGELANSIDPFSQEEVQSLGDDKLVLSNGDLTVAVNGELFLAFVKSEIESGRSLKDMVLHFADAPSLNLNFVDLSSQVWLACHILEDNYASELMRVIYNIQAMAASYKRRLCSLDPELIKQLQIFVHDLIVFGRDGDARHRLEAHLESQVFYLSETYFTSSQVETILAFPGKNGLPLQIVLDSRFKEKKEVCAAHTLAPMVMTHFDIPRDFQKSQEHRDVYKAFCKAWRTR